MQTKCQADSDSDCHHEMWLEFGSTLLAGHFYKQVQGAIEGCKIGSGWDDMIEEAVDHLLNLVGETVEMDSMPKAPVSLVILKGDTGARYARMS